MMLEGAGFEVVGLGVYVDRDNFIKTATEKNAQVIVLSALLTATMPSMENTIKAIKEAGLATRSSEVHRCPRHLPIKSVQMD